MCAAVMCHLHSGAQLHTLSAARVSAAGTFAFAFAFAFSAFEKRRRLCGGNLNPIAEGRE